MSFFPRFATLPAANNDFTPLFRFLDDYSDHAVARQQNTTTPSSTTQRHLTTFAPRFDIREIEGGYELHGELPGVDSNDVNVEFTEENTLTISGHTERHHSNTATATNQDVKGKGKQPAIEDAPDVEQEGHEKTPTFASNTEVATTTTNDKVTPSPNPHHKRQHEWIVTERTFGNFSRTFQFPHPVDKDAVTASLKNGILVVTVPKRKVTPSRKVTIDVE